MSEGNNVSESDQTTPMHPMDDHVLGQIGLHLGADDGPCGAGMHLHLSPVLLEDDGHLDFGVLGVFLDMASSQAGAAHGPFVHADISIHRIARPTGEHLHIDARNLRAGKRSAIIHIAVRDEHGVHVADSTQQLVFPSMPPDRGHGEADMEAMRKRFMSRFDGRCTLPGRLHDIIGIEERTGDEAEHQWSMPLGPSSRNGFGGLHGGVAFDLVTEAAAGAATRAVGPVEAKSALLRYLAPATVGPFRAVPVVLPQEDGSVYARVEVRDDGNDSLLCILGEVHLAARA